MSAHTTAAGEHLAEGLIPLLKEFTQKLGNIGKEAQELMMQLATRGGFFGHSTDLVALRQRLLRDSFKQLRPAATQLAQHVSQLVEHGGLEDLTRLELRLRLAEYEATLRSAEELLRVDKA